MVSGISLSNTNHYSERVSCQSLLPIKQDSLQYGSRDGGLTIVAKNPDLMAEMDNAGKYKAK